MRDFALISGRMEANGFGRDLAGLAGFDGTSELICAGSTPAWARQQIPNAVQRTVRTVILGNDRTIERRSPKPI
jgi:hypothetical protein